MREMKPGATLPLSLRLSAIRQQLLELDAPEARSAFNLQPEDLLLKTTISLCPECLVHVPAIVFSRDSTVWMRKTCTAHGVADSIIENDVAYYHLSNKDCWGRRYAEDRVLDFPLSGSCCGGSDCDSNDLELEDFDEDDITPQLGNKSCTILVEITNACNLTCAVCYSDAKGDRKLPAEAFKAYMQQLIDAKGQLDSVQLTGGEAILHPEFWEMVAFLHSKPVKKIYLPTNGILFAKLVTAELLVPFKDKLMVLLQFDGQQPATNRAMRNANPANVRDQVIQNLSNLGIHMQLTMTLTLGVNDHEIGWVVETALRHPHIKVVALQPVSYSGRYDLNCDPIHRLTLSDCIKAVAAQLSTKVKTDDFKPIPCSHPNCGWITLFVQRFGLTRNIARHINFEAALPTAANRTLLDSNQLRSIIDVGQAPLIHRIGQWAGRKLVRSTDVFVIAVKPFMDRFNYDQDRISSCCHHLLDTAGRPVSFCEYNARIRPDDPWTDFPPIHATKSPEQ
ncbi:radical SAM protein [soil metagenome]